jgi:hypothetical protein
MRAGDRLRLGAAVASKFGPDPSEREQRPVLIERGPQVHVEREPHHVLPRFGSGAYSAKLFAGTRHRFSGLGQPRLCGDAMLRILVTGAPPNFGGGRIPQRIMISSRTPDGRASWVRIPNPWRIDSLFAFRSHGQKLDLAMGIDHIRNEIKHMRAQILRQRSDIRQLARAGIVTASAEALLGRMLQKVDDLSAERDRLLGEQRVKYPGTNKVIKGTPAARRL